MEHLPLGEPERIARPGIARLGLFCDRLQASLERIAHLGIGIDQGKRYWRHGS